MSKLNIEDIFVGETLYAGDYDEVVTIHSFAIFIN